jgi:hypothetical protein
MMSSSKLSSKIFCIPHQLVFFFTLLHLISLAHLVPVQLLCKSLHTVQWPIPKIQRHNVKFIFNVVILLFLTNAAWMTTQRKCYWELLGGN